MIAAGACVKSACVLHVCTALTCLPMLKHLIQLNDDPVALINYIDPDTGVTPLMVAGEVIVNNKRGKTAEAEMLACVCLLLASGASKTMTNAAGQTALGWTLGYETGLEETAVLYQLLRP